MIFNRNRKEVKNMSKGNHMGPDNEGPGTGWGMGFCKGSGRAGFENRGRRLAGRGRIFCGRGAQAVEEGASDSRRQCLPLHRGHNMSD
jgi:hypothetical protein